jgi:antitoxin component YwqK of YwqJK toxin-antitoxin module
MDEEISIKGEEEYERMFEDEGVKINYAGRPMLVKVIKEYTSNDGSTYVDVKDMNNGQVATLVKDYIDEKTNGEINGDDLQKNRVTEDLKKQNCKEEIKEACDEEEIKKQKVQWYKDTANDWIELCKEEGSIYSDNFISMMTTIKNEPYSKELYDGLCLSYEYLRDSFLRTFKGEFNRPRVQALTKRFLVLTTEFRKKFGNNDSSVNSLVEFINKEMSVEGGIIYKRKFEDNGSEKDTGASGPVKIEYRGKEKIVEIMNECTHKNGKNYIWVRDLSDNGKTKTLFKEYVKYVNGKVDITNKNGRREEYTLKDNKLEGEYKQWYPNGQLSSRGYYKEGKPEGEYNWWGPKGNLSSKSYYKEGKPEGEYKGWYDNGKLRIQYYYKEGKKEGEYKEWDYKGILNKHYLYKNNEIVQNLLS